jgi:hypothetical protein
MTSNLQMSFKISKIWHVRIQFLTILTLDKLLFINPIQESLRFFRSFRITVLIRDRKLLRIFVKGPFNPLKSLRDGGMTVSTNNLIQYSVFLSSTKSCTEFAAGDELIHSETHKILLNRRCYDIAVCLKANADRRLHRRIPNKIAV